MGYREHKEKALKTVNCAVLTVSDSRTPETDTGGQLILKCLQQQLHSVLSCQIVKDDSQEIQKWLETLGADEKIQAIILTGGTGLSKRDVTYETLQALLEKQIMGFGELFRYLSYQEAGPAAMMSRDTAGIYKGKVIISLPGSEAAVSLALEKLILPELGHMVWDATR
jgi:molybdenum cofactor biosynthesis protein B